MPSAETFRAAAAMWDIAVPSGPVRLPGLRMAGFSGRVHDPVELEVVPYPAVTLVIDFHDAMLVDETGGQEQRGSVAFGLAPGWIRARGRKIECLQVRLSPVLAHAVLGGATELEGAVVPLHDLWGRDAEQTRERLRATRTWEDRFAFAEAALTRRLDAGKTVDPEVAFVWGQLEANRGQVGIDGLACEVGWSRKRLWSRFRAQIGLTPKRAAQLIRFDNAAHRLAEGHSAALVAAESGYADQSHMHRDVRTFTGATPMALAVAPWLAVDPVAWADPKRR